MCLIVFAHRVIPGYELVLIANRDEFLERPTRRLQWWEGEEILAGKDLVAGGTWLGVNRAGVWTALTNVREIREVTAGTPSRGFLTYKILKENLTSLSEASHNPETLDSYAGFNLIYGNQETVGFISNRGTEPNQELPPGVYGLSNASLDTSWPKVEITKARFTELVQDGRVEEELLFRILADPDLAPDAQLPDTGVGYQWEKKLSAVYINAPEHHYGTRLRTILTIKDDGKVRMVEWGRGEDAPSASYEFFRANEALSS